MICFGHVKEGKLTLSNRKAFENGLTEFEGMRVEVEVKKAKTHRSNEQNKYYWAVVLPHALQGFIDLGNERLDIDTVHRFFKDRFLTRERTIVIPTTGEVYTTKTTTDLSKGEMMEYLNECIRFCAEMLNVVIPDSNDN